MDEYKTFVDQRVAQDADDNEDLNFARSERPKRLAYATRVVFLQQETDEQMLETAARAAAIEEYEKRLRYSGWSDDQIVQQLLEPKELLSVREREFEDRLLELDPDYSPGRLRLKIFKNSGIMDVVKKGGKGVRAKALKLLARLCMAYFGGLILIAPMLIMRLHPTLLTVVLTTSVFIVVVGIALAVAMTDADPKDVLGATAAYAAVLVVFVGQGTVTTQGTLSVKAVAGITVGTTVGLSIIMGVIIFFGTVVVMATYAMCGENKEETMKRLYHHFFGWITDYFEDKGEESQTTSRSSESS